MFITVQAETLDARKGRRASKGPRPDKSRLVLVRNARSHAARRVEAEENHRRYPGVRASGRRHLRASVPALLRTSSPDYEPWSPLPTTPLPSPKSSPRRASSFGVAVGGAEGGAMGGWLSTPPAAAEGAPAGEDDVSELKKQARYSVDIAAI